MWLCPLVYRCPAGIRHWLVCPREGCSLVLQTRFLFMNDVASTSADCSSSTVTTGVYPVRALSVLSRAEVARLLDASEEVSGLLRQVALAVLTSGEQGDDAEQLLETYRDFRLTIHQVNRGVRLEDRKSTRLNSSHVAISYAV